MMHFFELRYRLDNDADWNIDVSFWLDHSLRHEIADLTAITQRLTLDTRLIILWIKDTWHRLPSYHGSEPGGRMVSSRDIYDAVLQHGARTPSDFDAYLRARSKPARTE